MRSAGNNSCWTSPPDDSYEGYLASECIWTQFWVELDSQAERERYLSFLNNYVNEQKKLGRYPRPLNNRLSNVMEWMRNQRVVGDDARAQVWLAGSFLLVCLLNTVGLLLAKFLGRAPEIGLRRALGASRRQVFAQHLIESGMIGVVGSVLGRSIEAIAGSARYFAIRAELQRAIESGSAAATTCAGMTLPSTRSATSGLANASRYQRPRSPRTERTNTSSPSTTTQMIVR